MNARVRIRSEVGTDAIDCRIVRYLRDNTDRWCDVREIARSCNSEDRERTRQPTRSRLARLLIECEQPIASGVQGFKWAETRSEFDATIAHLAARVRGLTRRIRAVVRVRNNAIGEE